MASLKLRVARLERSRPPAQPFDPALFEETLALMRAAAARHGVERIVMDQASFCAAGLGVTVEAAAEMLREALSDVINVGYEEEGADGAGA
jgi:hypothetical protein